MFALIESFAQLLVEPFYAWDLGLKGKKSGINYTRKNINQSTGLFNNNTSQKKGGYGKNYPNFIPKQKYIDPSKYRF